MQETQNKQLTLNPYKNWCCLFCFRMQWIFKAGNISDCSTAFGAHARACACWHTKVWLQQCAVNCGWWRG